MTFICCDLHGEMHLGLHSFHSFIYSITVYLCTCVFKSAKGVPIRCDFNDKKRKNVIFLMIHIGFLAVPDNPRHVPTSGSLHLHNMHPIPGDHMLTSHLPIFVRHSLTTQ